MQFRNIMLLGGLGLSMSLSGTAYAGTVRLVASLSGAAETQGGAPDGSGNFSAEVDTDTGDVCYTLTVDGIGDPVAAHIHAGAAGADGKPVTPLDVTDADDDLCIALEPATLKLIAATPSNYYVNVHTKDFPAGAVRGQLAKVK